MPAKDYTALAKNYPTPPATAGIVFNDDWGQLSEKAFLHDFAGDLPPEEARVLYAADDRKDDECRLAHQAVLLCRVFPRPDDQSRPGALLGLADGR
jgi:hypothetical protein